MSIITPSGRYMGRNPDVPKTSDRRYALVHHHEMNAPLPPSVDLRDKLPPCFDQGKLGSCGPNAGAGLMAFLFPDFMASRLALYYNVRELEGDVGEDAGVQTRDVLRVLTTTGAISETDWPYDIFKFADAPPDEPAVHKLKSYSRLTTAEEYLACLAAGYPFLIGFNVPASFDDIEIKRTGIMRDPELAEDSIGGHDVLAVGYDLHFRENPLLLASGIDPSQVSNHALIIRNSWSPAWGMNGHFFMSLRYSIDTSTSNDAWTGRI